LSLTWLVTEKPVDWTMKERILSENKKGAGNLGIDWLYFNIYHFDWLSILTFFFFRILFCLLSLFFLYKQKKKKMYTSSISPGSSKLSSFFKHIKTRPNLSL
jgi:hypothetical protein